MLIGWHLNAIAMPEEVSRSYPFRAVGFFETNSSFKMAWSAFGVVPFSRHEVCDWWSVWDTRFLLLKGIVSDQGSLFQTEGVSPA